MQKNIMRSLWIGLVLALALGTPLMAQYPYVMQWWPDEYQLADLDPTWVGDVELPGSSSWTWFTQLNASATQILVAAPEHEIPYQKGVDFDGTVSGSTLQLTFVEPGVYSVTIHYQNAPTRTYMLFAGAKKQKIRCDARDPLVFGIRRYAPPAHDLYTVNSSSPDGYLDCARVALNGEVNVNGWNALRAAIKNRVAALGRPITVFALSHGDVSQQTPAPAFTIFNANANVGIMTAAPAAGGLGGVKGEVTQYNTFSCCTGKDVNAPPAGGPHLLDALAAGLTIMGQRATASGWDRVTVCLPTGRRAASLYTVRGANLVVR